MSGMTETQDLLTPQYWKKLKIGASELDMLSSYLLEEEKPSIPLALAALIVGHHINLQESNSNQEQSISDYLPEESFTIGQALRFPELKDKSGIVSKIRAANSLPGTKFSVIEVEFEDQTSQEFASELADHALNEVAELEPDNQMDPVEEILAEHGVYIASTIEASLRENAEFVYIAGRWFLKALTADFSDGQLNLAEAILDMNAGGPLGTEEILSEIGGPDGIHPNLASFSLDLALQDDERFDEIGIAGEVAWFLRKMEPQDVQQTPLFLRYEDVPHDREMLSEEMLELEQYLHDEHSPIEERIEEASSVEVRLIFPHWRSGSLPLTKSMEKLFPTAYESPRVRFEFVDAKSGERYPGWVVRAERYVDGLRKWYTQRGLMPGSYVKAQRGKMPGEIIVDADTHHSSKEWVRTALIGADGGVVYATLKQTVVSAFDERMMIFLPSDISTLDQSWEKQPQNLERSILASIRELTKLNPQQHAHAAEIYAAVNVVKRCPPAPILAILATHPEVEHVGHLHFRMKHQGQEQ